jgi:preprotein translocase subunit SecA
MQMSRVELVREAPPAPTPPPMVGHHLDATTGEDDFAEGAQVRPQDRNPQDPKSWGTVGRNEPCPCGSGKKYKHCHGALEA